MSVLSSCSVESDWSDEEMEELEKMFGTIQHKSSLAENTSEYAPSTPESTESSASKWKNLKKSRRLAMAKLQNQKSLKNSLSSTSSKCIAQ